MTAGDWIGVVLQVVATVAAAVAAIAAWRSVVGVSKERKADARWRADEHLKHIHALITEWSQAYFQDRGRAFVVLMALRAESTSPRTLRGRYRVASHWRTPTTARSCRTTSPALPRRQSPRSRRPGPACGRTTASISSASPYWGMVVEAPDHRPVPGPEAFIRDDADRRRCEREGRLRGA